MLKKLNWSVSKLKLWNLPRKASAIHFALHVVKAGDLAELFSDLHCMLALEVIPAWEDREAAFMSADEHSTFLHVFHSAQATLVNVYTHKQPVLFCWPYIDDAVVGPCRENLVIQFLKDFDVTQLDLVELLDSLGWNSHVPQAHWPLAASASEERVLCHCF